jgi:hypothetical protein
LLDKPAPYLLSGYSTDLIDGKPPLHTVSIPLEAQLGVRDEISDQLRRITRSESAISLIHSEGRVVMMESDRRFDTSVNQAIDLARNQPSVHPEHSFILIHRGNTRDSPDHRSISIPSRSPDHPHHLSRVSERRSTSPKSEQQTEWLDARPRDRKPIGLSAGLL